MSSFYQRPGTQSWDLDIVSASSGGIRQAFSLFPSGVVAVCADQGGTPVGMLATSFSVGVSYEPPMVLFSVQNSSSTWPVLRRSPRLGISVLGREHEQVGMQLASKTRDRFAGLDLTQTEENAILIEGSAMWLDCQIHSETPAGDHHVVILQVKWLSMRPDRNPLIYHSRQFRELAET